MTAFQLAQYLGAAGTAAFMLYHLALYFRPLLESLDTSGTKPLPIAGPRTDARPTPATTTSEILSAAASMNRSTAHESNNARCVQAFAYLQEIRAALLEECGVEGERAAQLLEPIAPLLLRQKGSA